MGLTALMRSIGLACQPSVAGSLTRLISQRQSRWPDLGSGEVIEVTAKNSGGSWEIPGILFRRQLFPDIISVDLLTEMFSAPK